MASNGSFRSATDDKTFEIHKAVFRGDLEAVKHLLEDISNATISDMHGNTPLHLAVMLGRKDIIELLLAHGAKVNEKNGFGWNSLDEAVCYGDKPTITLLVQKTLDQAREGLISRRQELVRSLNSLGSFYAELKWEFHTWVPFLSRLLPSDVCKIYKTGSCVRLDSTLGDFSGMRWTTGDLSFIFNGEDRQQTQSLSMLLLDNIKKEYQRMKMVGSEDVDKNVEEHVNALMSRPVVYANMSTQPIKVTRAQAGWFYRVDKEERVGDYNTAVHDITDMILISRRRHHNTVVSHEHVILSHCPWLTTIKPDGLPRREHLTPEQIQQQEDLRRRINAGEMSEQMFKDLEDTGSSLSLPPPPPCEVTWEEYASAPPDSPPHLGRPMDLKVERRHFKASVCVTEQCPIELMKLLDILEAIVPYKHFHKLRQFVGGKMPPGFPVKLDVPVFPTVTATVTLQHYESQEFPPSKFVVPEGYTKAKPKRKREEEQADDSTSIQSPSDDTQS